MAEADVLSSFIPFLHKPPALLPIARHRQSLLYLIETFPVTIVVGQTGSGKTTQIPQFLEQAGWCANGKMVAVTQVGTLSFGRHQAPRYRANVLMSPAVSPQPRLPRGWRRR
jgi:ATP-dependent RNA helicase DDX35